MARRSRAREVALQLLFQRDQNPTPVPRTAIEQFVRDRLRDDANMVRYCLGLYDGTLAHQAEIDERLTESATNWRLSRMHPADRNVLRMAAYELLFDSPPQPLEVVINEGIELARRFGSADSPAFVNGVLDKIARTRNSRPITSEALPVTNSPRPGRFHVVVADFITDELRPEREVLGDIAEVSMLNANSEADLTGKVEDADAIMIYHCVPFSRETLARLSQCKLIVRCGVGYDNVDYRFARERGIPVANVPDYGTEEVADSAIGLMLALTRGINFLNNLLQRNEGPWGFMPAAPLHRLRGRVFAIIGLGRIGTATALRAKALGMDVAFYDPYKPDGYDKALGIRRVEKLDDLLRQAFVLSVHCPLTDETRTIVDERALSLLPDGAYLVNTARGATVDTTAIPAAIRSGKLRGAALDVLPQEPPPDDHPLLRAWRDPSDPCHDRVILNPHIAFYAEEGLLDMRVKGAQACRRALLGEPLRNVVN
jgi:transcription antitermination factor NusB